MKNLSLARGVLQACAEARVREIVLCAGARNAPFVSMLSCAQGVQTYSFFEERSAAFFAIGRIQATDRPVAVVTTSGTAAAELLPATIEAEHQGLPLILITADRPKHYRGSGAPQTIIQPGLFSHYVEKSWDIEGEWNGSIDWSGRRPIHLNVCFSEPLLDGELLPWDWPIAPDRKISSAGASMNLNSGLSRFKRPLVVVGGLPITSSEEILERLRRWRRPVYVEGPSQLRGRVPELEISEKVLTRVDHDCVLHIGSVPTLRYWRDLESSTTPVYHFSHLPYSGLPRSPHVRALSELEDFPHFESWTLPPAFAEIKARLQRLLEKYPLGEPGWVHWLSRQLPSSSRLFLGNSLPIREWDLAATPTPSSGLEVFANRGVNGIDGLISTFLGLADPECSNWALIGDLSALYDLSGPWALAQRSADDLTLVVMNNGGGKIFHRIFHNPLFENRHALRFGDWARMWNLDYTQLREPMDLPRAQKPRVIEIIPSEAQTEQFWREWESVK